MNNTATLDQLIHKTYVDSVKPIADCMRMEQQHSYQQLTVLLFT